MRLRISHFGTLFSAVTALNHFGEGKVPKEQTEESRWDGLASLVESDQQLLSELLWSLHVWELFFLAWNSGAAACPDQRSERGSTASGHEEPGIPGNRSRGSTLPRKTKPEIVSGLLLPSAPVDTRHKVAVGFAGGGEFFPRRKNKKRAETNCFLEKDDALAETGSVSALIRRAESILDAASVAEGTSSGTAIVMDRTGGLQMLNWDGWTLNGIIGELGAAEVYIIRNSSSTVSVEAWSTTGHCTVARPRALPRAVNAGARLPQFSAQY